MNLKHHKTLSTEKWAQYPFFRQILMIANELNRAGNWINKKDFSEAKYCYERAMELFYLTIPLLKKTHLRKEFLRAKETTAKLFNDRFPDYKTNSALIKMIVMLDPQSYLMLYPA